MPGRGRKAHERDPKAVRDDLRDIDLAAAPGADQESRAGGPRLPFHAVDLLFRSDVRDDGGCVELRFLQDLGRPVSRELGGLRSGDHDAPVREIELTARRTQVCEHPVADEHDPGEHHPTGLAEGGVEDRRGRMRAAALS